MNERVRGKPCRKLQINQNRKRTSNYRSAKPKKREKGKKVGSRQKSKWSLARPWSAASGAGGADVTIRLIAHRPRDWDWEFLCLPQLSPVTGGGGGAQCFSESRAELSRSDAAEVELSRIGSQKERKIGKSISTRSSEEFIGKLGRAVISSTELYSGRLPNTNTHTLDGRMLRFNLANDTSPSARLMRYRQWWP